MFVSDYDLIASIILRESLNVDGKVAKRNKKPETGNKSFLSIYISCFLLPASKKLRRSRGKLRAEQDCHDRFFECERLRSAN